MRTPTATPGVRIDPDRRTFPCRGSAVHGRTFAVGEQMPKLKLNVADLEVQGFPTAHVTVDRSVYGTPTCGLVSCDAACWTQDPIHNPAC